MFVDETTEKALKIYILQHNVEQGEPVFAIRRTQVYNIVKKYGKFAGVNNLHPHTFRHSFVVYAESRGMPINVIRQLLGHNENRQGTMVYAHDGGLPSEEYALLDF